MLRAWTVKNTFISNVIPLTRNYLSNNYITKNKFNKTQNINCNICTVDKQIVRLYNDSYNTNDINLNIRITEQDHIYPQPYNLISTNFIHSSLHIKFNNTNINEYYNIQFNKPDNFYNTIYYLLIINDQIIQKTVIPNFPYDNKINHTNSTCNLLNLFQNKLLQNS